MDEKEQNTKYEDGETAEKPAEKSDAPTRDSSETPSEMTATFSPHKEDKKKISGAYWYVPADNETILKTASIRNLLTIICFMLQLIVLALPQDCLMYVTNKYPSYAYVYMWVIFVLVGVAIFTIIMNYTRYKILKRIPVERAPSNGFKRRVHFGTELFMVMNALPFVFELSFICMSFDGVGLVAMFICLAATGGAIWARQATYLLLRNAERIDSPDSEVIENIGK